MGHVCVHIVSRKEREMRIKKTMSDAAAQAAAAQAQEMLDAAAVECLIG